VLSAGAVAAAGENPVPPAGDQGYSPHGMLLADEQALMSGWVAGLLGRLADESLESCGKSAKSDLAGDDSKTGEAP